ncbi:MAG: hypothetical protein HY692_00830 [Cyanobacteria bacterium NC_groundwater_1444_Ag_S-0.65um_54_12]|nr:hypothetical protein [Cyanobacteria bacterium NC_groundwater_1444_Ag_S-0.65um_54_12]
MEQISAGRILIYHLFELAEEVDLGKVRRDWADSTIGQIVPRRQQPGAIQFRDPPVILPLGARPLTARFSGAVRAKIFDFGVASICWELDAPATWPELVERGAELQEDLTLEAASRRMLDEIRPRLLSACRGAIADSKLVEDYFIVYVEAFSAPLAAEVLLANYGGSLASLLRGERGNLSTDERIDALRLRHSYLVDDLVIVTWNAAFIYDPEGSTEHVNILEYANAELLDLRYYDTLLDRELDAVYAQLQQRTAFTLGRAKFLRTSQRLMRLMIEVWDLQEKIRNALKVIGDMYSARVYRLIADRLRLQSWEESVDQKLRIAQQVYQVLLEELNQQRFMLLEIIIVLLILLETIFFALSQH